MTTLNSTEYNVEYMNNISEYTEKGYIEVTDHDEENDLTVFSYKECNAQSPSFVKSCRGVVVKGGEIILKTFGYTEEFTKYNSQNLDSINYQNLCKYVTDDNLDKFKIFFSEEGTLIRVWYHESRWFISTHKKLDAFKSKWSSSVSFGQMFEESVLYNFKDTYKSVWEYLETLDKGYAHTFLVRNTNENRIVCDAPQHPTVFYAGSFSRDPKSFVSPKVEFLDVGINTSKSISRQNGEFKDLKDLLEYGSLLDPRYYQGILMVGEDGCTVKIVTEFYSHLFALRNNEPSVMFRYLQIRMNASSVLTYKAIYNDRLKDFNEYEHILVRAAHDTHESYLRRYVYKQYVIVPKELNFVMKKCHEWHLQNRIANIVTLNKVFDILNEQVPVLLNAIIKHYKSQDSVPPPVRRVPTDPLSPSTSSTPINSPNFPTNFPRVIPNQLPF